MKFIIYSSPSAFAAGPTMVLYSIRPNAMASQMFR